MSEVYLYTAIASGVLMVALSAWVVSKTQMKKHHGVFFKFSSPYLAVLFIALMVDSALRITESLFLPTSMKKL
ncbi:MAG: hypothetical protein Ct9H300mP17_11350 [Candidatus Nitrosopelagicus sp.]|nr:MAG: hypothetical protein Ct9H300mP17_11350 [Candidatus Nitrosopelagicus sp.]